jgi:hypothetical protein
MQNGVDKLLDLLQEQYEMDRDRVDRREKFGWYGENACMALSEIMELLRQTEKYGDDADAAIAERIRDEAQVILSDRFPEFERVWQ